MSWHGLVRAVQWALDARPEPAAEPAAGTILRRVLWALALYGIATLVRLAILPVEARVPYLTYYPATVIAFYVCGTRAGWLMVALSAATGYFVFTPPYWHLGFDSSGVIALLVFLGSAWLIGLVVARLQQATGRERQALQQLEGALARVRAGEQRLQTMLDEQTEMLCRFRADRSVLYVNPAWCRSFGGDAQHWVGSAWRPMAPPDELAQIERQLATLTAAHPVLSIEHRVMCADGKLRWCQFVHRGTFDAQEQLLEIQCVGRDITELVQVKDELHQTVQQQAERLEAATRQLRMSEARLRSIIESATDAILTIDETQNIVLANPAAERMFGGPPGGLTGTPLTQLLPPAARTHHHDDVLTFGLSGVSSRHMGAGTVLTGLHADGHEFPIDAAISRTFVEGRVLFTAIVRDITVAVQTQAELQNSQAALQRLLAAQNDVTESERRRIARELHDDLLQQLAAARLDLAALDARLAGGPAELRAMVADVDELALELIATTRRIVNDLRPQMLEDLGLVTAIEVLVNQFSKRNGIACQLQADDALGDELLSTPALATTLYRLTQEALHNVAKHASASRVLVRLEPAARDRIELVVSDNGLGMTAQAQHKPHTFGLLGMRERVRSIGGSLNIRTRPGAGTTIEVSVPRSAPVSVAHDALDRTAATVATAVTGAFDTRLQDVIDALPGNIAVLDRDGKVLLVNRAWCDFARANGDPALRGTGPGANYLEVCRRSAQDDPQAAHTLDGLHSVIDGRQRAFACTYPCHSADEQRWFHLHATGIGHGLCMVTHLNVTPWADPDSAAITSRHEPVADHRPAR